MPGKKLVHFVLLLLLLAFSAGGCATTDRKIDLIYESTGIAKGGSGDFFLSRDIQTLTSGVKVLGEIKNRDGVRIANINTDVEPSDLVLDAFIQEMEAAGYRVKNVKTLPVDVKKGLRIVGVKVRLDEVAGRFSNDASCSVKLSIEPWQNGNPLASREYEASYSSQSRYSFDNGNRLLHGVLQKTLQELMTRAAPELVVLIEQQ